MGGGTISALLETRRDSAWGASWIVLGIGMMMDSVFSSVTCCFEQGGERDKVRVSKLLRNKSVSAASSLRIPKAFLETHVFVSVLMVFQLSFLLDQLYAPVFIHRVLVSNQACICVSIMSIYTNIYLPYFEKNTITFRY